MLKIPLRAPAGQKLLALLLGVFCALLAAEAALRLGGSLFRAVQEKRNRISIGREGCRILCLGESTTAGGEGAWPALLEGILSGRYPAARFSVINKAVPGYNTTEIVRELDKNLEEVRPGLVIAMMGVNDGFGRYYEGISDTGSMLFRHFRVYKLFRILLNRDKALRPRPGLPGAGANLPAGGPADPYTPFQDRSRDIAQYAEALRRKIAGDPGDADSLYLLGRYWANGIGFQRRDRDLMKKGEALLLRAARLAPGNSFVFLTLGRHYSLLGELQRGLPPLRKAAELNPSGENWYYLGQTYKNAGMYAEAERALLKAMAPAGAPGLRQEAVLELCWLYVSRGNFPAAEALLQKAHAGAPYNEKIIGALAGVYEAGGRHALAREYAARLTAARGMFTEQTRAAFSELRRALKARGIRLAVMQYPLCDPAPLRELLGETGDIIFIDNGPAFRKAVAEKGYAYYFQDMFAGNFGHCTAAGKELMARGAADALAPYLGRTASE